MEVLVFLVIYGFLAAAVVCFVVAGAVIAAKIVKRRAGEQAAELLLEVSGLGARRVSTEVLVGRDLAAEICLAKDEMVSRRHARIWCADGVFRVDDLGSTNGTFVNERRIVEPTPLRPGDEIRVGQTTIRVVQAPQPQNQRPASAAPSRPTRNFSVGTWWDTVSQGPTPPLPVEPTPTRIWFQDGGWPENWSVVVSLTDHGPNVPPRFGMRWDGGQWVS